MHERGVVVEANGRVFTIAMDVGKHEGCKTCGACRASADGRRMLIDVRDENDHEIGESVSVEIPGPGQTASAILLLVMPLVFFLAGIGVGWALLPGEDGLMLLLGLCGMAVGWGIASLVDRHVRRSPKYQPRIVKE